MRRRRKSRRGKTMIVSCLIVLILICVILVMIRSLQPEKIEKSGGIHLTASAPVSSARIVGAGVDNEDAKVGDLITGWCDIEDVDIGTSASVFFTLPDGTKTQTEYIAVNRNQRVYAELMIETAGEYEMVWELTNREIIKISIAAS